MIAVAVDGVGKERVKEAYKLWQDKPLATEVWRARQQALAGLDATLIGVDSQSGAMLFEDGIRAISFEGMDVLPTYQEKYMIRHWMGVGSQNETVFVDQKQFLITYVDTSSNESIEIGAVYQGKPKIHADIWQVAFFKVVAKKGGQGLILRQIASKRVGGERFDNTDVMIVPDDDIIGGERLFFLKNNNSVLKGASGILYPMEKEGQGYKPVLTAAKSS